VIPALIGVGTSNVGFVDRHLWRGSRDLALKVLALGGVYVAGGIAVKIIEKIKDGTFFRAFRDKMAFRALVGEYSGFRGAQ